MIENLYWVAIACAAVACLMGTRAAFPLLLSAAVTEQIRPFGLLANWKVCIAIDAGALLLLIVMCRKPLKLEWIIGCLFVPALPCYFLPDPWRYWGSSCVVITQLLLTIPLIKYQGIGGFVSHGSSKGKVSPHGHG